MIRLKVRSMSVVWSHLVASQPLPVVWSLGSFPWGHGLRGALTPKDYAAQVFSEMGVLL